MKSKSKFLVLATLLLGVLSCSPKGDGSVSEVMVNGNKVYVFSLNDLRADTVTISLSSLVEDCTLVQLEDKDDAFSTPWFTTVTDNYIGVRDSRRGPYKLFDRSGKFLCNVGSRGNGPGEYPTSLYDDIIDEKNGLIYVSLFSGDRILVYNTSGNFVREFIMPQRLQKPKMWQVFLILSIPIAIHYITLM